MLPGETPRSDSSFDRVLRALEDAGCRVRRRGHQATGQCPVHRGNSDDLSVTHKSERGGMTRLNCFACHASERELLDAVGLGLADRFDQPLPERQRDDARPLRRSVVPAGNRLGPLPKRITEEPAPIEPAMVTPKHLVREYDYTDENGDLLYQNVRYEWETTEGRDKTFEQRRPGGAGRWVKNLQGVRRVLRHLPALVEAIATGRTIWLAEGEKDDESLNRVLGAQGLATTNNNGAGSLGDLIEQLRGATVIGVIDRDASGYKRALAIHTHLADVAASVQTVLPAVTAAKADATDHLEAGHGLDEFVPLSLGHIRVLVAAAETTTAATMASRHLERAQIADQEARAQLVAAADARQRGALKAAEHADRYAQRWAHEAVRHAEKAGDQALVAYQAHQHVEDLLGQHGRPPADLDHAETLMRAEWAQTQCQHLAEQTWQATGKPLPEPIARELARATPTMAVAAAAEADEPAETDGGNSQLADVVPLRGSGGRGGQRPSPIRWTQFFRDDNGHLGLRRFNRDGDEISPAPILNLDARVIRVECMETDTDDPADSAAHDPEYSGVDRSVFQIPEQTRVAGYVIAYTHPESREEILVRVPAERARSCDWLADLPHMGLDYDSRTSGRSRVWDAIRKTSTGAEVVTVYRSTGWHKLDDHGWTYTHAGGGMTAEGNVAIPVQLRGPLARVDLPAPVTDPALLRSLFQQHSLALCDRLDDYVGAALIGVAFRSVLGWTGPTLALFGVPGSYKSAAAALTMQHFGVRWERGLPSSSMSGQGATLNALRPALWEAKDCLYFGDDFAPDQSLEAAMRFLSQFSRMQYNREARDRWDPRGGADGRGGVRPGERTRTTSMVTTEVRAGTISGQERLAIIDLAKGQLDLSSIIDLDRYESRFGRAAVMASLLRWMAAQDIPALRDQYLSNVNHMVERRRAAGMSDRDAEAMAHLETGWELLTSFLVDAGAYAPEEAGQLLDRARIALDESIARAKDPDAPTTLGERCRQLIVSGLRTGAIHVSLLEGKAPPLPQALRLGYRRVVIGMDHHTREEIVRAEARGDWVGIAYRSPEFGNRLHVDPTAMTRAIVNIARQAQEPINATKLVLQRELAAVGLLRTTQETTPQGPVTRYTVGVIGASGRQERLWDLDADRLFDDDYTPPTPQLPADDGTTPDGATGDVTTDSEQDNVPELTDSTPHHAGATGPCAVCGNTCSLYIADERIHLACWKRRESTAEITDPAAADAAAPAPPTLVEQQPPAAAPARAESRPEHRRQVRRAEWAYSAAVIDTAGIYLPDGTVGPAPETFDLDSIAAVGEEYRIGHPAGAGLLVVTQTLVEHLGLVPDMDEMSAPDDKGQPVPDWVVADRIKQFLAIKTAVLSNGTGGWQIDGGDLGPWTRIRSGDRAFRLVLEPYVWIWDQRQDSGTPFLNLPDPADDPAVCWAELARRLERLSELLEIPWSTSPGVTGEALFDQIQRRRGRSGGRVLDQAGLIPESMTVEQPELEREVSWSRKPTKAELSKSTWIHGYDRRGSYLSSAGGIDLGVGDPAQLDAAEADDLVQAARQQRSKIPFGLWKITLPAWDQAGPPPHPEQQHGGPVERWVTTTTLVLLLDDEDLGGAGYTVSDLQISGAWCWPDQARLLEPWYTRVRKAFLQSREDGDAAVDRAVKAVYTGYIGRMAASFTLKGNRPWHHQPAWRAAILAASRGSLWRAVKRHQMALGRIPVAIDHDEVLYLDDHEGPADNPPAADNGRLGALKPSRSMELSDRVRQRMTEGTRAADPTLWKSDR